MARFANIYAGISVHVEEMILVLLVTGGNMSNLAIPVHQSQVLLLPSSFSYDVASSSKTKIPLSDIVAHR